MADRVCVMNNGVIVEQGLTEQIFKTPIHKYTKHLLSAEPTGIPHSSSLDAPSVMKSTKLKVWFPLKKGVLRRVVGHVKAVDGVSVDIKQGQTLGVVGESGSGKSTLGRALLRLERSNGTIIFKGTCSVYAIISHD